MRHPLSNVLRLRKAHHGGWLIGNPEPVTEAPAAQPKGPSEAEIKAAIRHLSTRLGMWEATFKFKPDQSELPQCAAIIDWAKRP